MKSKYFIFFLILFSNIQLLVSQNKLNIDSLLTIYKKQSLDTLKVRTVNHIINYYMYRSSDKAKKYSIEQLKLSKQLIFNSGIALSNYHLGTIYHNISSHDSAKYYYNKSLKIAKQINNHVYMSQAYRGLAILEFNLGNLTAADSINNMDLANTIKFKDTAGIALAYDFKGTINQNKGYYSIALTNVLKGLKIFEEIGDSIRIADCYIHLGTLENNLGNLQKAIDFNQKALKIYRDYNDIAYQAEALNNIGVFYMKLNELDKALNYYDKSIEKSRQSKSIGLEAATYTNLGETYFKLNKYKEAIKFLNQSIDKSKTINAKRRIALAQSKLAKVYYKINNFNRSKNMALSVKQYAIVNENISLEKIASRELSKAYEKLGNSAKALYQYKLFKKLSDSILNKEKVIKIEELRIQFDVEKKEREISFQEDEIKILNVKAKNDKLTKTLYGIGMFSFFAIAGLLYFGFKQRIKKNKIARQKQEEKYKQEIAFKKKELASQTLHLVQKNTFIQELRENIEKIKQSPDLFKVEFRRLVMLLKKESAEDKDWEIFKSYFTEVHNNFDQKIKSIATDVSEKEIRLASFLRMNLTTKEIATMFNVLPDSVLKSKYRLKKKLGLKKDQNLASFLNTL